MAVRVVSGGDPATDGAYRYRLPIDDYGHIAQFQDQYGNPVAPIVASGGGIPVVASGFLPFNITSTTTATPIKAAAGYLHAIVFNKPVATSVITIYDNPTAASGTVLGTITIPATPQPFTLLCDYAFATGLTLKVATAACDLTVSYS